MKKLQMFALAVSLTAPGLARAQTFTIGGTDRGRDRYESNQNFALEVRGGPWLPNVDDEPGVRGCPFASYFADSYDGPTTNPCNARVDDRLMVSLEFDWQALRINYVGTLGLGVSVGYSSLSAFAPTTQSDGSAGMRTGQRSSLHVVPTYAVAVFRFDAIARHTVVPIVPYVKAGFGVDYWWVSIGGDPVTGGSQVYHSTDPRLLPESHSDERPGTEAVEGLTTGLRYAAGVMFRLDFLEPRVQRAWDLEMGVNHSYLFAEYSVADMRGQFSSSPSLNLSWSNFTFGVALEF